jgi:hypothetical protein
MTAIEREFAGRVRTFELRNDHSPTGLIYESEGMTLADLARRGAAFDLGASHVRHVLVHALCRGRMRNLLAAEDLVDEAMREQPFAGLVPLAVDIIGAAYAGAER